MNTIATRIARAQLAHTAAVDARQQLEQQLDADYPSDHIGDDDDAFDAWNDAYEDARMARGGFAIDDAVRATADELLRACRDLAPVEAYPAFDAALAHTHGARRRVLDLCVRMDTTTIDKVVA